MNKTNRPLERIYLTAFSSETADDGTIYSFLAIDDFSKYVFMLGVEKTINKPIVLNYITKLMNNEQFYKRLNDVFTLVMPFGNEFQNDIEKIINEYGGSIVFNEKIVADNLKPVLKAFDEIM